MRANEIQAAEDPRAIRRADSDLLSLALIDARNHTLAWLSAFEARDALERPVAGRNAIELVGEAGRWPEWWITRHLQRSRGEACDPHGPRLGPADAAIDAWFDGRREAPAPDALRGWLAEVLDSTLDLLGATGRDATDAELHVFRAALLHEDRLGEALAEVAAELQLADPIAGVAEADAPPLPGRVLPARPPREALAFPAQRVLVGSEPGGYVPANERWAHEVAVPAFEIDALPVSWARFIEFAEDGGYDERAWWSEAGWTWLQAEGRRAPRHVEQLRGGVLVQRRGRLQRVSPNQPVLHASRHEAEAWCRWAGRRLPTEPEWELAALAGASRGFVWGDVFEWVAGSARPWPGFEADPPATLDTMDGLAARGWGVLRGASWMTRPRCRHPKARRFAPPARDTLFAGFRSCAI